MSNSVQEKDRAIGEEQMSLNSKYTRGGIPITAANFLILITE